MDDSKRLIKCETTYDRLGREVRKDNALPNCALVLLYSLENAPILNFMFFGHVGFDCLSGWLAISVQKLF